MKSKLSLVAGILIGASLFSASIAGAVSIFQVQQGGTGVGTFTSGQLIYGNGTNALTSVGTTSVTCTGNTTCTSFTAIGPSPITINSTGGSGSVTQINTTYPILGGPITTTGTISTAFGTTSTWGLGNNGFVITGATGIPFTAASSTLNLPNSALANSSVTVNTNSPLGGGGAVSLGGALTLTCTSCNTSSASVTSITAGTGLNGGTITTAGTITEISYLATSSTETATRIPVWSTTSGTPATLSGGFAGYTLTSTLLSATNASTTQLTVATGLQIPNAAASPTLGTAGYVAINTTAASTSLQFGDGTATRVLYDTSTPSAVVSSSTLSYIGAYGASGTSTIAITTVYRPTTILGAYCQTDVGTANIDFLNSATRTNNVVCSTTPTFVTFSTNNTWTMGQTIKLDVGRQATNPNTITVSPVLRAGQ